MVSVAGASRFLNSAVLANLKGQPPSTPSVIADLGTVDLLDIARSTTSGIGLSASARALNKQFLAQTKSGFNQIFGLSTAELGTNETIQQAILALRSRIPESQLSRTLRGLSVDEEI